MKLKHTTSIIIQIKIGADASTLAIITHNGFKR